MNSQHWQDPEPSSGEHFRRMKRTARRFVGALAAKLSAESPQFVDSYKFAYYMQSTDIAFDGLYERFSAPLVAGPAGLHASAQHPVIVVGSEFRKGNTIKNYYVSRFEQSREQPGVFGEKTYQVHKLRREGGISYDLVAQKTRELNEIPIRNGVLDANTEIFTLSHMDRAGADPTTMLEMPDDIDIVAELSAELTHVLHAIRFAD